MEYSNRANLPEILVRAVKRKNSEYSKGKADWSVTQLISPPQISILKSLHHHEMSRDIVDEFWPLLGSAVHSIMMLGAEGGQVAEERLFVEIDGKIISGAIDLQDFSEHGVSISDYKVTTTYVGINGAKDDWISQLNIYRWMVEVVKKTPVTKLQIVAIYRDWQSSGITDPGYPGAPIGIIDIPLWTMSKAEEYVRSRIAFHRKAEMLHEIGEPLPECSADERWERNGKWAVMKPGAKRIFRRAYSEEEANELALKAGPEYEVTFIPGKASRCLGDWCGVNRWCRQFNAGQIVRQEQGEIEDG